MGVHYVRALFVHSSLLASVIFLSEQASAIAGSPWWHRAAFLACFLVPDTTCFFKLGTRYSSFPFCPPQGGMNVPCPLFFSSRALDLGPGGFCLVGNCLDSVPDDVSSLFGPFLPPLFIYSCGILSPVCLLIWFPLLPWFCKCPLMPFGEVPRDRPFGIVNHFPNRGLEQLPGLL